jgi:pimeloyl-ACP methyl ester carboxylesterase
MAGYDLEKHERLAERPNVQFGRHLVQQGYVVVCTEAFPYNTVPDPESDEGFAWWKAASKKLLQDNPRWTGIGKLTWDTRRAADLLLAQPDIDPERIMIIGHSLGGKMAFCTGTMDERIKAIIGSDFGMGWNFTNWDAPWYFGEQVNAPGFTPALHQLLALHAPGSYLLIGGEADRPESWQYIDAARPVYALQGRDTAIGHFYHGTGHQPTNESIVTAYQWLAEQFALPEQPWSMT